MNGLSIRGAASCREDDSRQSSRSRAVLDRSSPSDTERVSAGPPREWRGKDAKDAYPRDRSRRQSRSRSRSPRQRAKHRDDRVPRSGARYMDHDQDSRHRHRAKSERSTHRTDSDSEAEYARSRRERREAELRRRAHRDSERDSRRKRDNDNRHAGRRSHRSDEGSSSENDRDARDDRHHRDRRHVLERRRRDRSRERDRARDGRGRRDSDHSDKRSKTSKEALKSDSWGKYGIISDKDTKLKAEEFRVWLIEERRLNPERLAKEKRKREFARFVEAHNSASMPHDKFYNMAAYERRMAMIRNGDTLAPETSTKEEKDEWDRKQLTYNFEQDERAHLARIRASHAPLQAELTKEEIMELRRLEKERLEISQMRRMGMEIPRSMGVRMEEVIRESVADMNHFHS